MKEHVEKKKQQQVINTNVGEFEIVENYVDGVPVEENIQSNEINLQKDKQAGNQLVQNLDNVPVFANKAIQPEISMDERFREAHKRAHESEAHPAKMKSSTLKKRRKEFERKTTEQSAMLAVKEQIDAMKNGPLRNGLYEELSKNWGSETVTVQDDPAYTEKMMDAVMYLSRTENLSVPELAIISRDLTCGLKNYDTLYKFEDRQEAKDRFNGKMLVYEKLFKDALSWNPDDFALKDNHVMARDGELTKKMEKLTLVPMLKTAIAEYREARDGDFDLMKKNRTNKDKEALFPEDMLKELECRLTYYEDIKAEFESRIDLMSNKYYSLLGQSDTSSLKLPDLDKLSKDKEMDPELRAYYDAIKRQRERKDTGRSLKGKKAKSSLEKIRKQKHVKAPDARFNSAKEAWEIKFTRNYTDGNKKRQDDLFKDGTIDISKFNYDNDVVLEYQMASVYKDLGVELTEEKKAEVKENFKERLAAGKHAKEIFDDYENSYATLRDKLEDYYNVDHEGKFKDVREERECVVSYLMNYKEKNGNEYGYNDKQMEAEIKGQSLFIEQSRIHKKVMLPFHTNFDEQNEEEKERRKKDSAKALYDIIKELAEQDHLEQILTKYKTPEEFCAKCTKEEYSYIMMMARAGQLINQHAFEHPGEHRYLMELINEGELKDFYLKLKTCAYDNVNTLATYMQVVSNGNYAFLDKKTMDAIYKTGVFEKVKPTANRSISGGKGIGLRTMARNAYDKRDQLRIGEAFAKKRAEDIEKYGQEVEQGKWKKSLDLLKKN